ncbi:MAG: winged helix-turn-helix transcriptional regulator [Kiritimatiellae bacterium]|nr:winged helix-turn-helix transcriptional regulator [Kiritimatiellia bacterium]
MRHRDRELLRFEWVEPQGVRVISVNDAERRFLPLEMHGVADAGTLWRWLTQRTVPKHRHYIQMMLGNLGIMQKDTRAIIEMSKGLSLNDVYWVVPDGFAGEWKDFNLYANPFSKTLAVMAFTGGFRGEFDPSREATDSPEFTTNGMLAKCWRRRGGEVFLYKGGTEGSSNSGFEPYSEFYAAQIAEAMGLDHVAYGLEKFKGRLCSTCPLFTSDKYGYVPAGRVVPRDEALADPRFADVFLFDAVIFNTDRHMGNFGYLVDNDTNMIVGAAPIFDNGYGLFSLALFSPGRRHDEFDDLRKFVSRVAPALYDRWLGFPGGLNAAMRARLERLRGFRFKHHKYYNLPVGRLHAIEYFLQKRVSEILEFGGKSDDLLNIGSVSDSVNHVVEGSLALQIKSNLRADPFLTYVELAEILHVSESSVARKMKNLQATGEIRRIGADKNGHWEVVNNQDLSGGAGVVE